MTDEDFQPGGDRFPLTRRSVIEAARSIDAEEREQALEALCAAYWKPIYKYVRWRWKRPAEAAQDLTQGFFAELLERELLDKFDGHKSRRRTYSARRSRFCRRGRGARRHRHRSRKNRFAGIPGRVLRKRVGAQSFRAGGRGPANTVRA